MCEFYLFLMELSAPTHPYFCVQITSVNVHVFSPNLLCALILWRSGLALLMDKFCHFWQSYLDRRGYYRFAFLLQHVFQD